MNWMGDKRDMKDECLGRLDGWWCHLLGWGRLGKEQVWELGEAFKTRFLHVEFEMVIDIQVNMLSWT